MATPGILIDSSIIIDYFRKKKRDDTVLCRLFQQGFNTNISVLTVYELLCGAKSDRLYKDTEKILSLFDPIDFTNQTAIKSAELYLELKKDNQLIETVDILIAATALNHSLVIATLNKNHFQRFKNLRFFPEL